MIHDWYSHIISIKQQELADPISKKQQVKDELLTPDPACTYHYLASTGRKDRADGLRSSWINKNITANLLEGMRNQEFVYLVQEYLVNPRVDIEHLPECSVIIQYNFTLGNSYISRDEQDFYIVDNPVRKDKVFRLPLVAASSWKGALRSAVRASQGTDAEVIERLFGNERAEETGERLRAGRLFFYPVFFTERSVEIINPHDCERRVGTKPIPIECVPAGAKGWFTLVYLPFDLTNKKESERLPQVAEDIQVVTRGLKVLFQDHGFGAKTSSGFGIAKPDLGGGRMTVKVRGLTKKTEELEKPPEEAFKKYLDASGRLKNEFRGSGESGLLSNSEYREKGAQLGGGSLKEFKAFKFWYSEYGEEWEKAVQVVKKPAVSYSAWRFNSFNELLKQAEVVSSSLLKHGRS
ncbi:MAG: RAMP superfamily CRISPR-associated protein [Candidatus Odinarchaeota archaeon]